MVRHRTHPWLNAGCLKAWCSDHSISSFSQQMYSVSLMSTVSPFHGYADDMQIYDHCFVDDMNRLTSRLVDCIGSIGEWMTNNRLKLNASKTEFIWFGSARRLARCSFGSIVVNGTSILPSKTVRNLGVVLDPSLSLAAHVTKLTGTLYFQIRQLRTIRRTLTSDACHALVRALVLSRLDYCNGLLAKAPDYILAQLSGVMRAAARVILQLPRRGQVSDAIRRLAEVRCPMPSVSTGSTSRSGSVSNCACSCSAVSMEQLLPTYRGAVFRSVRLPDDHTSVQPHLEICSFQGRTLLPLVRGHLRSPVPRHGTVSPRNSMTIALVSWRSGKNWKLIYFSPKLELSCVMGLGLFLLLTMLLWLFRRACKNIIIIIINLIICCILP